MRTFIQPIAGDPCGGTRVVLKRLKCAKWYSQDRILVTLPDVKFKTNLGYLEALIPCIQEAIKNFISLVPTPQIHGRKKRLGRAGPK